MDKMGPVGSMQINEKMYERFRPICQAGRYTQNVAPCPGLLLAVMALPWFSTTHCNPGSGKLIFTVQSLKYLENAGGRHTNVVKTTLLALSI